MTDAGISMRDHLAEVREEVDRQSQRFELAAARAGALSASDPSGAVEVATDADGRVTGVTVGADWRSRLADEALPGAVLGAYQAVVTERAATWADTLADPDTEAVRARPAGAVPSGLPGSAPTVDPSATAELMSRVEAAADRVDDRVVLEHMLGLLTDLDSALDQALEEVERRSTEEHTGRSTSGHVTARVSGSGELLGVAYDERWLPTAHSFNVGRETTEAVADAVRAFAAAEQSRPAGAMTELSELAADPAALAARLGFRG